MIKNPLENTDYVVSIAPLIQKMSDALSRGLLKRSDQNELKIAIRNDITKGNVGFGYTLRCSKTLMAPLKLKDWTEVLNILRPFQVEVAQSSYLNFQTQATLQHNQEHPDSDVEEEGNNPFLEDDSNESESSDDDMKAFNLYQQFKKLSDSGKEVFMRLAGSRSSPVAEVPNSHAPKQKAPKKKAGKPPKKSDLPRVTEINREMKSIQKELKSQLGEDKKKELLKKADHLFREKQELQPKTSQGPAIAGTRGGRGQ